MKTKTIFNLLAFAMLMPAMLLTTACSSSEDLADNKPETTEPTEPTEPIAKKGYKLPVTINVTRQGDDATRASYTDNGDGTGSLSFSTGDQLFVYGEDKSENGAGKFAGTIEWQSGGKFSGTITTEKEYTGTANDLFTVAADNVSATLLPDGYGDYGYLSINANNEYDAVLIENAQKSIANSKALAVEQLSFESAVSYTSGKGFELAPLNAILNFTISGLTASKTVTATLSGDANFTISGDVTTDETGKATFAMGVFGTRDLNELSLTVDGDPVTLVGSSKELEAGKIYNINRKIVDLSQASGDITLKNGDIATGTMTGQLLIEEGATVTLCGASVTAPDGGEHGAIRCLGDATIILADGTVNTAQSGSGNTRAAVSVSAGKTLTIRGGSAGTGKLEANASVSGDDDTGSFRAGIGGQQGEGGNLIIAGGDITAIGNIFGAGIGAALDAPFSDITIRGGTVTATGGSNGAGIGCGPGGSGPSECGNITIEGGTVEATGGEKGAGIGTGGAGGSCGYITIEGGTVTATGGERGAGIGSGESSCSNITISGGTVTATGGSNGAGIGSGESSSCGYINIEGGTVEATGGSTGAGIGSGAQGSCRDITISGGTVTATGGSNGAGIGTGGNRGSCCSIDINGGTVTATGGEYAAGIGSGVQGRCNGIYIGSNVTSVIATKGQGADNSIGASEGGSCQGVYIEDDENVTQN